MELSKKIKEYLDNYIDEFFDLEPPDKFTLFKDHFDCVDIYKNLREIMIEKFNEYHFFASGSTDGVDWFECKETFKKFDPKHNLPAALYKNHIEHVIKCAEYLTVKVEDEISLETRHNVVRYRQVNSDKIQFDLVCGDKNISFTLNPDDENTIVSADNDGSFTFDPKQITFINEKRKLVYIEI